MTPSDPFRAGGITSLALKVYLAVFAGLWALALTTVAIRRFWLHQSYPFDTFLFMPHARFTDFTVYTPRFAVWGQGEKFFTLPGFPFDYPAPLLLAELPFFRLSTHPLYAYLIVVALFAFAAAVAAAFAIPRSRKIRLLAIAAVLATAVFSYPLAYLIDRGNVEGLPWIASSLGLFLFVQRRFTAAAILLALAASMKIFPGVLLLLFLIQRRYRQLTLSVFSVALFTLASVWYIGPDIPTAWRHISEGLDFLRHDQVLDYKTIVIGFDHSLFAAIKQIVFRLFHRVDRVQSILPSLYLPYALFALCLFASAYWFVIRRLPAVNQIVSLSALSVLLPFVSYDYTLVNLYAPFFILVLVLATDATRGRIRCSESQLLSLLLPIAVLFTPQSYLVLSVVGFGAQVKTLALVALVVSAMRTPLPSSIFGEIKAQETLRLDLRLAPLPQRQFS